jgi:hypothetical protein
MPSLPEPSPDAGAVSGDWLYKQGEVLLGPVPARSLVDKLFRGEINGETPVCPMGDEDFKPIGQVAQFTVHVKKSAVKAQIEKTSEAKKVAQTQQRNRKVAGYAAVGALVLGGGAYLANYLAVHKPWRSGDENLDFVINVDPPRISLASAEGEVALLDPTRPAAATTGGKPPVKGHPTPKSTGGAVASHTTGGHTATDPDGLASTVQFDSSSIQDIVNAKTKSLYPCIVEEAKANPGKGARIPIEFTVGNDGHVTKLWIDNPDYRQGPLYECFLRTLKTWPFKPYQGEQANVSLNFNFGPRT